jgi:Flp pilus assembly protein TadG
MASSKPGYSDSIRADDGSIMQNLRRKNTLGQGLVEFVILLPILVLFIMIIFDLGRVAYLYSTIQNAAREGARYASIHHQTATSTEISAAARQLTTGLDPDLLTITTSYPTTEIVQVAVSYQFNTATPIIARVLGSSNNSFTLSGLATMRLEQ